MSGRTASIAGISYALIVLCMWGIFATTSGMSYETSFAYTSQTSRLGSGFFYFGDYLRIFTSVFYHVSYLLSGWLGIRGSFTAYQIVYAALWWARGMLMFLIVRRLLSGSDVLAFNVGALTLVHASDRSLQWIGQMNQFGFIFWMLLAIYALLVAFQRTETQPVRRCVALACCFEALCIWSYESPLFIIVSAPVILAFLVRPKPIKRVAPILLSWYSVVAVYGYFSYLRYSAGASDTYQVGVIRKAVSAATILRDLAFNVQYSLSFWSWDQTDSYLEQRQVRLLAAVAVAIFVLGALAISYFKDSSAPGSAPGNYQRLVQLLAVGAILLVLSFPAYLLLEEVRSAWRTQLLSGVGAAIVLGAGIALVSAWIPNRRVQSLVAILAVVPFVWWGSTIALLRGGTHRWIWKRHLPGVQEVLRAAPKLRNNTVVVLTNVPKSADPFGHDYWFDMALHLAYPGVHVGGIYYYDDGTPNDGNNLVLRGGQWKREGQNVAPPLKAVGGEQTLVLKYDADGTAKVVNELPSFICQPECAGLRYAPQSRIINGVADPQALRRYGPL